MSPDVPESPSERPVPAELPALVLTSTVVFPLDVVSLQVAKPRDLRLLDGPSGENQVVACLFPKAEGVDDADTLDDLYAVGVACRVIHRMRMPNETLQVVLQGLYRIECKELLASAPYLRCRTLPVEPKEPRGSDVDGLIYRSMEMVDELVRADGSYPREMVEILRMNIAGGGRFADLIGAHVNLPLAVKRRLVATADVRERLKAVEEVLEEAIARTRVEADVGQRVKVDIEQRQREGYLRAQMRAIRKELGEEGDGAQEVDDLRERVKAAGLPKEAAEAAGRELDRLSGMSSSSAEYHVARTYVTWILELPWNAVSRTRLDLAKARLVLDRDHYGLEDVKERILEFLAVRRLRKDAKGPILCLVGPPGVGKTSLGRSIAEAVGRPFVRMSVGGMHDESEIKGHRRTYVGSLPGKVIQALKRAGTRDPVFMIDEVDKMGHDPTRGDPSSALLEVLDPEQNGTFSDHYLDLPFDLSKVFFVATGNVLDDIPGPLRDRMEVVMLSGYTREEKFHIAKDHLVPKVVRDNGLDPAHLSFSDEGLHALIDGYTREAGVRNLERLLARVARKVARKVAEGRKEAVVVRAEDVAVFLETPPYLDETKARDPGVGVATGLAWTAGGGTVLFIEALGMPGTGRVQVTGRLGEVMRESADLALSWVRANAEELGIDPAAFKATDVHIHVPEGATPKDGPSAGVTLVTALASLFTAKPVRVDLAMTGEVTLKGRVLPVGGIKEKVLAARRAGIRTVLLPEGNRRDLHEIPEEARADMDIRFSSDVHQNLEAALMTVLLPTVAQQRAMAVPAKAPHASTPPPPP